MRIDILTLFPAMVEAPLQESILKRAQENDHLKINVVNFRDYAHSKHKTVDDTPYGGGGGMVLKPEPIFEAVRDVQTEGARIILMCPQGKKFTQKIAKELSSASHLIFVCGHYEGVDERVREHLVTDEISIGDYVLTGGELPAMVIVDAVARLLPGVLGNGTSAHCDSFSMGGLEYPHYTRPAEYLGYKVPDVLLSGNHKEIEKWRKDQSYIRTKERRKDLL